jgi:hypothetical protein
MPGWADFRYLIEAAGDDVDEFDIRRFRTKFSIAELLLLLGLLLLTNKFELIVIADVAVEQQ